MWSSWIPIGSSIGYSDLHLIEVLLASFFIQLFGLANPLINQTIIDKVLMNNSPNALNVSEVLLIGVVVSEALLTSLRTYLFVDTTDRSQ